MTDELDVFGCGNVRPFTGKQLKEIAFPLGGIGTGTVSLGGRGQLRDWEVFNRPCKGNVVPSYYHGGVHPVQKSFFALRAQSGENPPVVRLLERQFLPPYSGSYGLNRNDPLHGLPRLAEAEFRGAYPFARIKFQDDALPISVTLVAFNPLIPLDPDDSGLPVAVLRYRVHNPTGSQVSVSLVGTLTNLVGTNAADAPQNSVAEEFGQNLNEYIDEGGIRGLRMSSNKYAQDSPRHGTLALSTTHTHVTHRHTWQLAEWQARPVDVFARWGELVAFWDDFSENGYLQEDACAAPSTEGTTHDGSLCLSAELAPGESVDLPFFITWHFPNRTGQGCGWSCFTSKTGDWLGNYYCQRFTDAWEVAEYVVEHLGRLESESRKYAIAMLSTTMPQYVVEAAMSNVSTLRSQTVMRLPDGSFHGFEGCHEDRGFCQGTCTHVWNYEQTTAFLFPSLSRSMRDTELSHSLMPNGLLCYRSVLPVGSQNSVFAAADGQMGCIMKLYRDWQLCGDSEWLKKLWPRAKRALEFAWLEGGWDADQDGVMEGVQHCTYDTEYHGPNPMCGTWYLGALRAGEEMADAVGDDQSAQTYRRLFENGSRWIDEKLYNGEYYVQKIQSQVGRKLAEHIMMETEIFPDPIYQAGSGCLLDQLIGQYFAHVVDLGYLLDRDHIHRALQSVFRYNFHKSLAAHATFLLTFALNDEAGAVICTWPRGDRPRFPMVSSDYVFTGSEYAAATLMLYEGLQEEGLRMAKAVRERFDGEKRNPWDEIEGGHHYARAMAAWALILALSGFSYSAPREQMKFAPKINAHDFRCFWSTPFAWGRFSQRVCGGQVIWRLHPLHGAQEIRSLVLAVPQDSGLADVQITLGMEPIQVDWESTPSELRVSFKGPITVPDGQALAVSANLHSVE